VTRREFRERLQRRARRLQVEIAPEWLPPLEEFLLLLAKWNAKINLTSLPLDPPDDHALDRLILEPLTAVKLVPDHSITWYDLGSGGGSPAFPLKIARPSTRLTMFESKSRKVAFLREAVRAIGLDEANVEGTRLQEVDPRLHGKAQLVTVRALRTDAAMAGIIDRLMTSDGRLLLFRGNDSTAKVPGFQLSDRLRLPESGSLGAYDRVPRGTVIK
jgi:16S rRNA (guanine527-N7)-methyltransferase